MLRGGYTGKILRVNLTEQTYQVEETTEEMARHFIGGAGFGVKTLCDEVDPQVDALSPENKLTFFPGPFTGTNVPCSGRFAVTAKSPLTGAIGMGLSGGHFPAEIKFAGYDGIIVEGKAEKPCYLWIKDDKVSFRSAEKYWGTRTFDTQQMIKDDLRDQNIRVACIGPAGEREVKLACIINERRAVGRKGLGAVMGSKNLKAIAIRGEEEVPVQDKESLREGVSKMTKELKASDVTMPLFSQHGSVLAMDACSELGINPTKNWSATGQWDPVKELGVDANASKRIGNFRCFACPVGCSQFKLAEKEEYAGILSEGPEFETLYSLGGHTGVGKLDAVIAADRLCDELGIDTISAGVVIGFAMELYEKGILTSEDTGGLELKFGNDQAMMQMLQDISYKRGLGELLSEGTRKAAEKIGQDSEKIAMHVKGLELPGYDIRGAKAHGLNFATSYTGADHNRGYAPQEIFGAPFPEEVDRFAAEGKGRLTKFNQDMRAANFDSPIICGFMSDQAFLTTASENTSMVLKALSGIELTTEEVDLVGDRINTLARVFNVLAGNDRSEDTFPERIMTEPIKGGNSDGHYVKKEELEMMLDEYYEARGWDKNGVPTIERLKFLGLDKAAEMLKQSGK